MNLLDYEHGKLPSAPRFAKVSTDERNDAWHWIAARRRGSVEGPDLEGKFHPSTKSCNVICKHFRDTPIMEAIRLIIEDCLQGDGGHPRLLNPYGAWIGLDG